MSSMILVFTALGIAVEIWKVVKAWGLLDKCKKKPQKRRKRVKDSITYADDEKENAEKKKEDPTSTNGASSSTTTAEMAAATSTSSASGLRKRGSGNKDSSESRRSTAITRDSQEEDAENEEGDEEEKAGPDAEDYDIIAMKYVGTCLLPFIVGYAYHNLTQNCHRSWYSWGIQTLASCVYAFGFVLMTPQLFINYKMKSVAHLPWRRFIYRALNTFIDDLFSFIIRMPAMHRLSVFRDDIVFIIYLYQRYLYGEDKSRSFEEEEDGSAPIVKATEEKKSSGESKKKKPEGKKKK